MIFCATSDIMPPRTGRMTMLSFDEAEDVIDEDRVRARLAGAADGSYWLDDPRRPAARPARRSVRS